MIFRKNNRRNLTFSDIEDFEIQTRSGTNVSLAQISKYDLGESPNSIAREDQEKIVKVTSAIKENYNAVELTEKIKTEVAKIDLPQGHTIEFGGDFEDVAQSFADLYRSMTVGILLILFCLVIQFNSFKQPLIILITVPLALIGVFPGLMLLGLNLSFPAFLGVVALGGIVVNNAIVLIDRINENREQGMALSLAIGEATNSRFQAIFLTTLSNIVGILPLALSNELGRTRLFDSFRLSLFNCFNPSCNSHFLLHFEVRAARKRGEPL